MFIDITLKISPKMASAAQGHEKKALMGHLGTHFDIMNKEFPLEYLERAAIVFDVSHTEKRDIEITDIDLEKVKPKMFVAFYTGFIEKEGYGSHTYFTEHPQLSHELIEALVKKRISIIGIDFAGVRQGKEHTPADQYCADNSIFVIENLCNLLEIMKHGTHFQAYTAPMNFTDMTGLPCRVIAKI
ncbi:cyclase family protein [Anaerotignum sp.]|uniref:cyclase family protein n=1 Tax=Anaerotignum sp. TaxID=2039241 RepID=UPI0027148D1C|nr:cyclase family protein [Anaerotignum sp.]